MRGRERPRLRQLLRHPVGNLVHLSQIRPQKMSSLRAFSSSVGTKLLIGITGLALFLYLITHILGNVLVFAGRDTFNQYSHMLLSNPLIPVIEIGLVLLFILHIFKRVM